MDEFSLIEKYFKPLSAGFRGSLDLSDDAALVSVPPGCELAITTDAISAGVHFLGSEEAALIARKLLRVNLSDLAAMGATPFCYFLALMLPPPLTSPPQAGGKEGGEAWLQSFVDGLREDQEKFHIHLGGGDTTATRGPLSLCATALGSVPAGQALRRNGAKAGDHIYVSGTLGDSALGLLSLRTQRSNPDWIAASPTAPRNDDYLINRYLLPEPRIALGQKLIGLASACMDISDGLVQDLGHICKASGVGATIHRPLLPLSTAAQDIIGKDETAWDYVLGGGDDYELLFTAPPEKGAAIKALAMESGLPLTNIGVMTDGKEVCVLDENKKVLAVKRQGFKHF